MALPFLLLSHSHLLLRILVHAQVSILKTGRMTSKIQAKAKALEGFIAHGKLPDAQTSQEGSNASQNNTGREAEGAK